jgi:hypothetical protein
MQAGNQREPKVLRHLRKIPKPARVKDEVRRTSGIERAIGG